MAAKGRTASVAPGTEPAAPRRQAARATGQVEHAARSRPQPIDNLEHQVKLSLTIGDITGLLSVPTLNPTHPIRFIRPPGSLFRD